MKVISMDRRKDRFVRVGSVSKLLIKFVKPKFRQDSNLDSYGQYDHKTETIEEYGEQQVHKWRRGYSDQPPNGESLEDVVRRVTKYFEEVIKPAIQSNENDNILIAAHGNSLRALLIVMNIYEPNNINSVELSTGVPIHVTLKDNKFSIKD